MRLSGKVALITGAGPMGAAIARRFAEEGAALVLTDISGSRLNATAEALMSKTQVVAHRADVTVRDEALAV
ncbi:MAG: SDR family NAD(P)-dependent oxidoreductase, partial [Hyphomicrobiales bacterium]|nr:SDR family NAD(P)-dependent oxidoreductase [Hyphomicrobiales bacterium]